MKWILRELTFLMNFVTLPDGNWLLELRDWGTLELLDGYTQPTKARLSYGFLKFWQANKEVGAIPTCSGRFLVAMNKYVLILVGFCCKYFETKTNVDTKDKHYKFSTDT